MSEIFFQLLLTSSSVLFLYFINYKIDNFKYKLVINSLFFIESLALGFFFAKINVWIILPLTFYSSYFLINNGFQNLDNNERDTWFSIISKITNSYGKIIGSFILFCIISYEFLGDMNFSTNSLLLSFIAILFFIGSFISSKYLEPYIFIISFLSILFSLFLFPQILFKILSGNIGLSNRYNLIDENILIYYFLGKPLEIILTKIGYNVYAEASLVSFEDMNAGILQTVYIARSCAGIASMQLFIAALSSYLLIFYQNTNKLNILSIIFLGLLVSYFANLLRMCIIVLVGHYYGIEDMLFVHEYLGWIFFTFWMFIFWYFIDYLVLENEVD